MRVVRADRPIDAAATLLAEAISAADARRGHARFGIAGGSAVKALAPTRAALAPDVWSRVRLTWVDERCVPLASPDSNRGAAMQTGPLGVGLVLPLVLDDEAPLDSVARVERELVASFDASLDVTLLGMGEDGHIASLFPGRAPPPESALAWHVDDSPKPPPNRITLTRRVLSTASASILLAAGEGKRAALERLVAGDSALPAHGLPGLVIVTDLDVG
jgi:6-phosphogluconolactonase